VAKKHLEAAALFKKSVAAVRKVAKKDGKDWDRLLPYLLFAYREAGFSEEPPPELLSTLWP